MSKRLATENIFETKVRHIAMAEEPEQPALRQHRTGMINSCKDLRWLDIATNRLKSSPPVTAQGYPRVFNSGVVLFTREGLQAAKQCFFSIEKYALLIKLAKLPKFYRLDQNFLGAASFVDGILFDELPERFNVRLREDLWNTEIADGNVTTHSKDLDPIFFHLQIPNKSGLSEAECEAMIQNF